MAQQWFFDALARDGQRVFFFSFGLDLRVVRKVAKKAAVVKGNLGGFFFWTNPYGFFSVGWLPLKCLFFGKDHQDKKKK